jgi:hypothetical protein
MAIKHQLSLNIVDGCNPTNFTILDTSNYAAAPISCPTLAITVPGTAGPIYFSQGTVPDPNLDPNDEYYILPTPGYPPTPYSGNPKFNLTIDNIFLHIQNPGETLTNLPDGLYTVSYCVAPCDKLKVEYYYLRTTIAMNQYASLLCRLRLSNCLPSQETQEMINQLHIIKMYLDSAKARAEVCHAPNEGVMLYEYALKLMANWERTCCSTC